MKIWRSGQRETTKIVWNHVYEAYQCTRCGGFLHYCFDFRLCPYCGRKIIQIGARRVNMDKDYGKG